MTAELGRPDLARRRRVALAVCATCLLALVGVVVAFELVGPPRDRVALTVLAALGVVSQFLRRSGLGRNITLSFLSIILLACIPTIGPVGAALVGALSYAVELKKSPLIMRVFNTAMAANLGWIGGGAYLLFGGTLDTSVQGAVPLVLRLGLPLLAADVVQMTANALLISFILRVDIRQPIRLTFVGMVSSSGLAYFGYGAISFLFVTLWFPAGVGPFSAVLILAPLFVAQWIIVQYAEEVQSHESALSGLVTAAEIKDPASRGHSERVARLAEWIGDALGLSSGQMSSLRFAAQLHDVGKVALPTRVVRRGELLDDGELELLRRHADQGARLLADVDFLGSSLTAIRHHHERWDGAGYPDGLAGVNIPLGSRIIAVCDAFDALTTRRPTRPALDVEQALTVVSGRAGSQLDPRVVEALRAALSRHSWTPTVVTDDELMMMTEYQDHDHPSVSDALADHGRGRSLPLSDARGKP